MKKTTKLLSGIFLLTITLFSCSTDTTDEAVLSTLEQELALENKGILKVESTTYVFKNSGEIAKFTNANRDFNFKFINEFSYDAVSEVKHAIEGLTITNPETGEFFQLSKFVELKNGYFKFDVELSTGLVIPSVMYKPETGGRDPKWHGDPLMQESSSFIGALIEVSQKELTGKCRAAMEVCSRTNGVPTIALSNGKGWFTAIEACSLECHS